LKKELTNNDSKTNIEPGSQSSRKNTLGSSISAGDEKNVTPKTSTILNSSQAQEGNKEKSMAQAPQTKQADKKTDAVVVLDDDYDNLPSSDDEYFDQQPQRQRPQRQQQQPSLKDNQPQQQQQQSESHHHRQIKSSVKNINNNNNVSAPGKHLGDDIVVGDDYDNLPSSSDEDCDGDDKYICTDQMVGFD